MLGDTDVEPDETFLLDLSTSQANVILGDAQGEAVVTVGHGGRVFQGKGFDTDIIVASAKAYLAAINRILAIKEAKQDNEAAGSAA